MDPSILVFYLINNLLSFLVGAYVYRKGIRGESVIKQTKEEQPLKESWDNN